VGFFLFAHFLGGFLFAHPVVKTPLSVPINLTAAFEAGKEKDIANKM